jgi:hypothetical protein
MFSIYWFADGAGTDDAVPRAMVRWIRTQPANRLIVYGGDVYKRGTEEQFEMFFDQMNRDVSDTCALPGNHDWKTASADPHPDKIPRGYDKFWRRFGPGESQQPVNTALRGGARYEHVKDIEGWRLVFLDTGPCNTEHWPVGDEARSEWLRAQLSSTPSRAKIVMSHHSRLSRGKHGDNLTVATLWDCLFDPKTSAPLAALAIGGHDHNATWYEPRSRENPEGAVVPFSQGIHVHVNGAGGHGHDEASGLFTGIFQPISGTKPDWKDDDNWCVTRIDLLSPTTAEVSILSFGADKPPRVAEPTVVKKFVLNV